jgi:hypothetical protein
MELFGGMKYQVSGMALATGVLIATLLGKTGG